MNANPKLELLNANNCVLALIDYQPQMFFGIQSHDRQAVINGLLGLARTAKEFNVPTILTSVETKGFSGNLTPGLLDILPEHPIVERSTMNAWQDPGFVAAVKATGRKKLILAGLWTEVCITLPALDAQRDGFETYFVADICGGTSPEAHARAIERMVQAGSVPMTWIQLALEWQRDWADKKHYDALMTIMRQHGGAYGEGIEYAYTMVHGAPPARHR